MPELPEVETVVRGLRRVLPGRSIRGVHLGKTDFIDDPGALGEVLPGRRIAAIERIGKFIRIALEPGGTAQDCDAPVNLMVHLGMTGRLAVWAANEAAPAHTHVFFHLDNGAELRYTDIRRFGRILLLRADGIVALEQTLGHEPLEISAQEFNKRIGNRSSRIKALLLDQSVLRGVGNIYADESLWRARIHPARVGNRLKPEELSRLRQSLQKILQAAINERGSSISNYLDAEGRPGGYQRWHRVYQRTGKPCSRCGTAIRHATIAGRSSHFCPQCQPAPRTRTARAKIGPATRKRGNKGGVAAKGSERRSRKP